MNCNKGLRKEFADAMLEAVQKVAKTYNVEEVVVERHDPMLIAMRGCLRRDGQEAESIEVAIRMSGDLVAAGQLSVGHEEVAAIPVAAPDAVYRSFDLSAYVSKDTESAGDPEPKKPRCD